MGNTSKNYMHSPISRLNIEKVGFMSAWNKFYTCSSGDI